MEETAETWGKLVGCYESGNKPSAFIQGSVFQGCLSKYYLMTDVILLDLFCHKIMALY